VWADAKVAWRSSGSSTAKFRLLVEDDASPTVAVQGSSDGGAQSTALSARSHVLLPAGLRTVKLQVAVDGDPITVAWAELFAAGLVGAVGQRGEAGGSSILVFGASEVGDGGGFLRLGSSDQAASPRPSRVVAPRAGTLRSLYCVSGVPVAGVVTVLRNQQPTALQVELAGTSSISSDTVHAVPVSAGDVIAVKVASALATDIVVSMELA
jgi:hypothetical protein